MTDIAINERKFSDGKPLSPFLKWAGGKRWFVSRYLHMVPDRFRRYIEPFLGGGAMYFALRPRQAFLSDLNSDLIDCYQAIKTDPVAIVTLLSDHHHRHCEEYYYTTRAAKPADPVQRAAWFIYLNRTCWNGLYRVNRKNEFNVPIGTKTNVILPTDDFLAMSHILSSANILNQDFEATLDIADSGDFVFVDPPYTVRHNLNGFLKYNDKIFSWADQVRLRDAVVRSAKRGAKILVTNANHESIRELYDGVGSQQVVERASVLSGSAQHRIKTEELVIRTWTLGTQVRPRVLVDLTTPARAFCKASFG